MSLPILKVLEIVRHNLNSIDERQKVIGLQQLDDVIKQLQNDSSIKEFRKYRDTIGNYFIDKSEANND